ncbi:hypothetical protein FJ414_12825 [Mesorhizobium sp. B3-1-6]|uniref:hypothetical protein n=1 Tax=Mesorhizobium sp. B3-1-6 TaxID=2589895 RepID=UPI00112A9AA3|nr:hypothetical protein [Mesorhizobium sp. B3-1-6]TPI37835.1 hypothetical protein FJ414_12825 [Mesorhizobium sp. B3-1-6]
MADLSAKRFFERAVTVHRYDCELIMPPPSGAESAETKQTIENDPAANEAVVRYVVATRPVYDGLRRLIGQVAGLLILAEAGGRRDVLDLPDILAARERWAEVEQRLGVLQAPGGLEGHLARLETAHATLGEVLDDFGLARLQRDWQQHLDRAGDRVKHAYAWLQAASEPRAGMTPVDFNHACCSCAQRWRYQGGNDGPIFDLGA